MENQFGVGISGGGVIGNVHADALQGVGCAKLVAVAEPREDAGRALADKHGATWYASYEEMLADPAVDVVIVATPSGLHPEQTVLAARAGKHVITEKPMAISAEGATQMIDACDQAGVRLAVIFQNRLSPDVFKVKRAIEAGLLGRIILANGVVHWHRTQAYYDANGGWRGTWALDGGGALMNQAIHTVDVLQWLMGGVTSIQAQTATLTHDIETEDTASASLRFANGALGTMQATTSTVKDNPVKVEVVGEKGRVVLESNAVTLWDAEQELSDDLLTDADHVLVDGWAKGEHFGAAHRRQLNTIFRRLADGTEPPIPGRDARKAVDVILGIYESARTGCRVDLA
ncbi:MAG TPA: Gfo/Idh/MocA family oxidoreductase [Thermomicrobiales bacterium]|nr:Gfo/Idh/MocA family oxidoreductase [Thermomicrobiales bacterium]